MIYRVSRFTDLHPIYWFSVDFFLIFGFTGNLLDLRQASYILQRLCIYIWWLDLRKSKEINWYFSVIYQIYLDLPLKFLFSNRCTDLCFDLHKIYWFTMTFMIFSRFSDLLISFDLLPVNRGCTRFLAMRLVALPPLETEVYRFGVWICTKNGIRPFWIFELHLCVVQDCSLNS